MNEISFKTFKYRPDRGGRFETFLQESDPYPYYMWCHGTFGPPGERWETAGGWYFFYTEMDVTWFIMRWGNK